VPGPADDPGADALRVAFELLLHAVRGLKLNSFWAERSGKSLRGTVCEIAKAELTRLR